MTLWVQGAVQDSENLIVFDLPYPKIERYQPTVIKETVETILVERMRLEGKRNLIYEPIVDMNWQRDYQFASVRFTHRVEPQLCYEVTTFSAQHLVTDFGVELLKAYLRGKEKALAKSGFEILLPPEQSTGPARFRILGARALSFTYAYLNGENRIIRGENWIEHEGVVHIVAIEAPNETSFKLFFERVRVAMNSMQYPENE